jgi:nicotinate phosphoribosyltransferase
MNHLNRIYRMPLGLLTDLYQISMAYSYWKSGRHEQEAVFHLYFRKNPFNGGYTVACGLEQVIEYIENFQFTEEDIAYLASLQSSGQTDLFSKDFLKYLQDLKLTIQVDAVEEGRLVFPQEPILRVQGPILQCQLLETALLNIINFQTLIATKASRVKASAGQDAVFEFGLRRAQGFDGGLIASRAAYIGGCDATSNVLAGKTFGIPVRGTHAHSWVMSFDDEQEAFEQFAMAMPNNSVLLVDTYDTLEGIKKAIETGKWLKAHGHSLMGIRLDSGDLSYFSIEARKLLDAAGFTETSIVGSNDLDEYLIENLKRQGAKINIWGVGTKLVTAFDQPALGGVYKLAATRNPGEAWSPRVKISEQALKTSIPGIQQIRRFKSNRQIICDMIYDIENPPLRDTSLMIDPVDPTHQKKISKNLEFEDLLIPVIREGNRVYQTPKLAEIRNRALEERLTIHSAVRRFLNPHNYPVGLESGLYRRRAKMISGLRGLKTVLVE